MNNTDSVFLGFVLGVVSCGFMAAYFWTNTENYVLGSESQEKLQECEKGLPRNEFCELKALPKQNNMENTN